MTVGQFKAFVEATGYKTVVESSDKLGDRDWLGLLVSDSMSRDRSSVGETWESSRPNSIP